jgi:UDP-N-acetylglucosamine--N-acetylmuramyl-(pentapeptide) pyrophosphoryl-undecaprenol N-acetylglucosamine transferase
MSAPVVLIMAGGTGGHVFPALALARILRTRSWQVVWLGSRRGIEARLVPAEGIPIEWLTIGGLRGKGMLTLLWAPFRLARALFEAIAIVRRHRPDVVVGLGGFVSGPGGVAAWLLGRPLVIHEQNAVAGFTNRCLAVMARRVLAAFPQAFASHVGAEVTGNPVRAEIAALPPPPARFATRRGPIRVLVIGGSQGALKLNNVVPRALALVSREASLEVRHQSGERWFAQAEHCYRELAVPASVTPFIDDMAEAYAWADLVVCRAGALTVSELAAAGVAAVFIPFAAAVDDHQTHNAQWLVNEGAACMISEAELTAERLASELMPLCQGRGRLLAMAERARLMARPQATEALADACESCVKEAA